MANIATLNVKLAADSAAFNSGLRTAQSQADKFASGLRSTFGQVASAIASGFAFSAIRDTAKLMDDVINTAQRLDIGLEAVRDVSLTIIDT